ncbi:MAG: hypothetical protein KatS3mg082_0381 [Nitrospiraceae bacterium]|nr:MAG: hypothetical protein KatS3mg082_0381 [Nitrospiraceae bacterium]
MVHLRMRPDHAIDHPDSSIPQKRADDIASHVETLESRAAVDQYGSPVRQLDDRRIALPDVEKRHS